MNREECLDWLYRLRSEIYLYMPKKWQIPMNNALDMAIKALEHPEQNVIAVVPCGDAISRQAVLEQINCWIGSGEYRYTNATDYLNKRITSLSSVSTEKTGRWIPVSERLPKKGEQVLCCNKSGSVFTSAITYINSNGMVAFGQHYEVIAWMPLPQPYKGESEDKE